MICLFVICNICLLGGRIQKFYRLNQFIQAPQIRLIDEQGKNIGIVSKWDALQKARELSVDLVEVAPNAKPPVCRLIEFKKFKYLESKKDRESRKKDKGGEIKEVRLRPFTDDHDLEIRLKKAQEWLKENNKVKFVIKFSGREMTHPEFGFQLASKITENLKELSTIERPAHFEGRQIILSLQPCQKSKPTPVQKNDLK